MTSTTTDLLEMLRGRRELRPRIDPSLAGGLRAWLEDDLFPISSGLDPSSPLFLTPRSVTSSGLMAVPSVETVARSSLLAALVAQHVVLGVVEHPMDDALGALESDPARAELVELVHGLDPPSFAQLAAELTAHHAILAAALLPIPATWLPRCNLRLAAALAGGRIVLGGTVSLMVGPPADQHSSVCLLEVTTAAQDEITCRRLAVLALLETLRSGAAPLRAASLSTSTGDIRLLDVTDDCLTNAVGDVVTAAARERAAR
jgi:hypothetical protein